MIILYASADADKYFYTLFNMITERDEEMKKLRARMDVVESLLKVKDCVIDGMKGEIARLQQSLAATPLTSLASPSLVVKNLKICERLSMKW